LWFRTQRAEVQPRLGVGCRGLGVKSVGTWTVRLSPDCYERGDRHGSL